MSFKKIMIIFMTIAVLLTLLLFAFLSNKYMSDYFNAYIDEVYLENTENIIEFAKYSITQEHAPRTILNSYIVDPIYHVEIYDINNSLIINSHTKNTIFNFNKNTMSIDTMDVMIDNTLVGTVAITREKKTGDTITNKLFRNALFTGGIISFAITIILVGLLLIFIIKYISKNINAVVNYANEDTIKNADYKIQELNIIAQAITMYRTKLAEKQRVAKQKIDKLLHETKTPLSVVKSQLEGINDGVISADQDRISSLLESVDHLDFALKDISNIIDGKHLEEKIALVKTEYSDEIEKIVTSLKSKFQTKGINLIYQKKDFVIATDKQALNSVMYNLLINSYKYTESGSVEIKTDNKEKTIKIKDTGIGIATEELPYIFSSYFRGRNVQNINGEGLGLSIAKETLHSIDAKISVISELNRYTKFIISFN